MKTRWHYWLLLIGGLWAITLSSFAQVPLPPEPVFGEFDPTTLDDIDLDNYPLLPTLTDRAKALYEQAEPNGRNVAMFSKVGDSMTFSRSFLVGFGTNTYQLGEYEQLQRVIDFFNGTADETVSPFSRLNYATALGFSTATALDSFWADADACEPNESPLACELRVSQSLWVLMMFGTNDVMAFDEATFDYFYRGVVIATLEVGAIPVLYTFPIRPEEPEKSVVFNRIVARIAQDYDLPLIHLVKALEGLENGGVDLLDTLHLTTPPNPLDVTTFDEITLQAGYTVRNWVTLQALDTLLQEAGVLPTQEDK